MTSRIRAALLGTVAVVAVGAGALSFQPARSPFVASATAQGVQTAPMSFADVVEKVKPAVVSVRVSQPAPTQAMSFRDLPGGDEDENGQMERFMRRFGEQFRNDPRFGGPGGQGGPRFGGPRGPGGPRAMSQGSGFFISADGFIVTNNHVVRGATDVDIVMDGGRTFKAKVVGTDERTDLALLKAEGSDFPFVRFAANAPRVGDWVLAVGNPFGLGGTVTAGIVSARGRDIGSGPYDDFMQIDAAVNRGNSGGPTFNVNGEVVGVNTAIFSPSGGNVGIAFAIPSEVTQNVVTALREGGSVQRGWLGVQIQAVTPEIAESLRLSKTEARPRRRRPDRQPGRGGRPEALRRDRRGRRPAGARRPRPVAPHRHGPARRDGAPDGDARWRRARRRNRQLGRLPDEREFATLQDGGRAPRNDAAPETAPAGPRLGLSLEPAGRGQGMVVTEVDPSGPAAQRGIRQGDVILDVAGRAVSSLRDVREALGAARSEGRKSALIRLRSGDGQRFVAIPLNPS